MFMSRVLFNTAPGGSFSMFLVVAADQCPTSIASSVSGAPVLVRLHPMGVDGSIDVLIGFVQGTGETEKETGS